MAQTLYLSDTNLTDRLPSLTSSQLATESQRLAACLQPASAWIDSVYPHDAPFTASPNAPSLIKQAAIEFALHLAHSVLGKADPSKRAEERARSLLNIDKDSGLARAFIADVHGQRKRIRQVPIYRQRDAEAQDDTDADLRLAP